MKQTRIGKIDIASLADKTRPLTWGDVKKIYDENPPTGGVNVIKDKWEKYYCVECMKQNIHNHRENSNAEHIAPQKLFKPGKCKKCKTTFKWTIDTALGVTAR